MRVRLSYSRSIKIQIIAISLVLTMLPLAGIASFLGWIFGERSYWAVVTTVAICIVGILTGIIGCSVSLYRNHQNVKESLAALRIVQAYIEALERLEIAVRTEFTQSKSKFDENHGSFRLKAPLL